MRITCAAGQSESRTLEDLENDQDYRETERGVKTPKGDLEGIIPRISRLFLKQTLAQKAASEALTADREVVLNGDIVTREVAGDGRGLMSGKNSSHLSLPISFLPRAVIISTLPCSLLGRKSG